MVVELRSLHKVPHGASADTLRGQARRCLDDGAWERCVQWCDQLAQFGAAARYDAAVMRGEALLQMGDPSGALSSFETVADLDQPDPTLDCLRGCALYDLGRLAEAQFALSSAVRGNPKLGRAYYVLGLLAELTGRGNPDALFRQARKTSACPAQAQLSTQQVHGLIEEAVSDLPTPVRQRVSDRGVVVADVPRPWDLQGTSPRSVCSVRSEGVFVYKRNLERAGVVHEDRVAAVRGALMKQLQPQRPRPIAS